MHFTSVSHPMPMNGPDAIPRTPGGRSPPRAHRGVRAGHPMAHHGLADGLHMGRFMQTLQGFCAEPEGAFTGA